MSGLTEVKSSVTHQWKTLTHIGTATNNTLIFKNETVYPIEIYRYKKNGASLASGAVRVIGPDGSTAIDTVASWDEVNRGALSTAAATDQPFIHSLMGSESLVSNITNSTGTRVVLLPGFALEEVSTTFALSNELSIIYREMTAQVFI